MNTQTLRNMISRTMLAAGAIVVSAPAATLAAPLIDEPVVAIVNNPDSPASNPDFIAVAINGTGFGPQVSGSKVKVRDLVNSPNITYEYAATNSRVVVWTDTRIVIKLPPGKDHPKVWLKLSTDEETPTFIAERYSYDYFSTNSGAAQSSGNPFPQALATSGSASKIYINEQWHSDLKKWDSSTSAVGKLATLPVCPSPGCFAVQVLGGDTRTNSSVLGDGAMVDPSGRVWFTEGGANAYTGVNPNHSRIVSYDPATSTYKIYNVPGDDNEISGLAWDAVHGRVWFTQRTRRRCIGYACATAQPTKLVSFNPSQITYNNTFDFVAAVGSTTCNGGSLGSAPSTPPAVGTCSNNSLRSCFTANDCVLISQVCAANVVDDTSCWHEYAVNDSSQISQIAVTPAGDAVWFANFGGTTANIGRLSVASGTVTTYPVHYTTPGVFAFGPWDIAVSANGDALFSHPALHTIGRFDANRIADSACLSLVSPSTNCATAPNSTCVNPCIDERVPAGFTSVSQSVSGIAEGPDGRVWFNQNGLVSDIKYASSVGFWKGNRTKTILFPSPQIYAASGSTCTVFGGTFGGFSGADMLVSDETGDAWFADYCRKRIGRLHRIPDDICQ